MTIPDPHTHLRAYLRALAESDDAERSNVRVAVRIFTPNLPNLTRAVLWPQLVQAVTLLADFQSGSVEAREIAPGWSHRERDEVAVDLLEQEIGALLDELTATERAA